LWIVGTKFTGTKGKLFYDTGVILRVTSVGTQRIVTCGHLMGIKSSELMVMTIVHVKKSLFRGYFHL
jgi:hypothetical protein